MRTDSKPAFGVPPSGGIPQLPCAAASLRRAARAVTQIYECELRPTGLTQPQFTLLQALALAGSVTQGQLGALLVLDSTTLSRTLKPLEAARWIRLRPGEDRRERYVELSRAGEEKLAEATVHWERAQEHLRSELGAAEWPRLLALLTRVTRAAVRE
jgi:DNA-binding MarR family transcriptional regulator